MQQKRNNKLADLISAGTKCSAGANTYSAALGLVVATKPLIDAAVNPVILTSATLQSGRIGLKDSQKLRNEKQDAAYDVAFGIRDSLKRKLGRKYSTEWSGTGFDSSLEIPRGVAALEQLLRTLNNFYTEDPTLEVPDVATALMAGEAADALTVAQTALTVKRGAVRALRTARKQKEKVLRARIRGVVEELNRALGPLDGRWDAFGLNQPGLQQVPERPRKVTVVMQAGGAAAVKWQKTPRAEYYRLWLKVIGVDEEAIPVGSPTDLDYMIESMPAASQVEVSISAANNGGESARSEVVVVITP